MNTDAYKEYRNLQLEKHGVVHPETWAKMDKFDREWFTINEKNGFLLEDERKKVGWSIYDHESAGNWDVLEILKSFTYQKPNCKKCCKNDNMVKHSDGEWICHHTHKIE